MLQAGYDNIPLTKYLVEQVMNTPEDRLKPCANTCRTPRWKTGPCKNAGQRVQIVKDDPVKGGLLQFGTEVVAPPMAASLPCWAPRLAPRPRRRS